MTATEYDLFVRTGCIFDRYRKYNLFREPGFNVTSTAELSTFSTDFGVRFGMATCFDMYFHDPIVQLVQELNITDLVFPVAWFSELPFLTGE
jgi:predicted amidohydrolase